jgi:hypothetical protein
MGRRRVYDSDADRLRAWRERRAHEAPSLNIADHPEAMRRFRLALLNAEWPVVTPGVEPGRPEFEMAMIRIRELETDATQFEERLIQARIDTEEESRKRYTLDLSSAEAVAKAAEDFIEHYHEDDSLAFAKAVVRTIAASDGDGIDADALRGAIEGMLALIERPGVWGYGKKAERAAKRLCAALDYALEALDSD